MNYQPPPEIRQLQQQIERSKIERARRLTAEERFRAGADLFDDGMKWMRGCIRGLHPEWSEEQVQAEVDRRKRISRKIDDAGLYVPCQEDRVGDE